MKSPKNIKDEIEYVKKTIEFAESQVKQFGSQCEAFQGKLEKDSDRGRRYIYPLSEEEQNIVRKRYLWLKQVQNRKKRLSQLLRRLALTAIILVCCCVSANAGQTWATPRIGMTQSDVLRVYGSPSMRSTQDGQVQWLYFKWWRGLIPMRVVPSLDIRFNRQNRVAHYDVTD